MKKRLLLIACYLALFAACAFAGALYRFNTATALTESTTIFLPKGTGFKAIVKQLDQASVIPDPLSFAIPVILSGKYKHFKPGEYEFPAGITPSAVMHILTDGKVVIHKLTIPEGLTAKEIVEKINAESLLTGDISEVPAEGSLLPETYYFMREDTRQSVIDRMQNGMTQLLNELWDTRAKDLPYASPMEAVTLASIVEKETRIPSERRRVAAVYVNRLKQGIKLQADPTTIYAIAMADGTPLKRNLSKNDLERALPHNTYANTGLPPTPIANPGRASIEAALNPLNTVELFFVATGNGGHYFAETYKGHLENIQKYRSAQAAMISTSEESTTKNSTQIK